MANTRMQRMFPFFVLLAASTITRAAEPVVVADQPAATPVVATPDEEKLAIYGAFLEFWNNPRTGPVQINNRIGNPPTAGELAQSGCLDDVSFSKMADPKSTPVKHLTGTSFEQRKDVRLIDVSLWRPRDPMDAINRGTSVERAVDEGYAGGLFTFSDVVFDDTRQFAAFSYSFVCGMLCGNGGIVALHKSRLGWLRVAAPCSSWIS